MKHFNSVQSYKQRPYWKKKNCQNNQNSYHWVWILSCRPSNLSFCLSSIVCSIKQRLCLSLLCRWAHHVISINNKMRSANKWTHSEGGKVMGAILWWGLYYIYPYTKSSAETNPSKDNTEYGARKDLTFHYILLSSVITLDQHFQDELSQFLSVSDMHPPWWLSPATAILPGPNPVIFWLSQHVTMFHPGL